MGLDGLFDDGIAFVTTMLMTGGIQETAAEGGLISLG